MNAGTYCALERRTNSPSISRPPTVSSEKSFKVFLEKSKETLKSSGVRFQPESETPAQSPGAQWDTLEEEGEEGDSEEGGEKGTKKSSSPLISALSRMGSQTKMVAESGLKGMKRLSLNIKYKMLPSLGLGGVAVRKGILHFDGVT